jgi:hypothetical protein
MGSDLSASPVNRTGRVTARIADGVVGEVVVSIRGGSEPFYAYPALPGEEFTTGTPVLVTEYQPPRTVRVVAAEI